MSTPLRQQYLQIKKQFPDTIVFFRLGDFYESFDDDAKKVAAACNIVLTARDMGTGQRVPLAGVPYHALDTYLARIINAGHKVAIVEQTSDEPIKGLMTSEVVRVIAPLPQSIFREESAKRVHEEIKNQPERRGSPAFLMPLHRDFHIAVFGRIATALCSNQSA